MSYLQIKRNKVEEERDLIKQSNILIDKLLEQKEIVNKKIFEYFGVTIDYENNNPIPCNVSVYNGNDIDDKKSDSFDISKKESLSSLRNYGRILREPKKYSIDFIIHYHFHIETDIKNYKSTDIDNFLNSSIEISEKIKQISKNLISFSKELGDMEITRIYAIEGSDRRNGNHSIRVMFEVRRKKLIRIDKTYGYLDKIN